MAYLLGLVSAAAPNFSNPSKVDFGIVLKPQFKNNLNQNTLQERTHYIASMLKRGSKGYDIMDPNMKRMIWRGFHSRCRPVIFHSQWCLGIMIHQEQYFCHSRWWHTKNHAPFQQYQRNIQATNWSGLSRFAMMTSKRNVCFKWRWCCLNGILKRLSRLRCLA